MWPDTDTPVAPPWPAMPMVSVRMGRNLLILQTPRRGEKNDIKPLTKSLTARQPFCKHRVQKAEIIGARAAPVSRDLEEKTMNRYEYKIEHLKLTTGKSNEEQLLEALNRFGADGWRLNRLYGEISLRTLTSWGCKFDFT